MMTDGNYPNLNLPNGKHFIMYIIVESLCHTPETNILSISTIFQIKKKNSFVPAVVSKSTTQGTLWSSIIILQNMPDSKPDRLPN